LPPASASASFALGSYPTPVEHLGSLSTPSTALWVKRDDLTHPVYGGSKVRKLERVLSRAMRARAKRAAGVVSVVTVGAVGSHHVLATAYFGREVGLAVEAVLFPQPTTEHVVEVLRAGVGLGLQIRPVASIAAVPLALARPLASGAHLVAPGGSSVEGALGFALAARELADQVHAGELPEPDWCVVALGSGGTAAGLAAGFAAAGLRTRVMAVCVLTPVWVASMAMRGLARACAARLGYSLSGDALRRRLVVDARFVGRGYGQPTRVALEAATRAEGHAGLRLDPTYTAKAFACAIRLAEDPLEGPLTRTPPRTVLYWHTLSSAPMEPLLRSAPAVADLSPDLLRLLAWGGRAELEIAGAAASSIL
jgi:D-cysteine desulfhydrase